MSLNSTLAAVTDRIIARSETTRAAYLERMRAARGKGPARAHLSCSGQAHAYAATGPDQQTLAEASKGHLGIVSAYNDMLSAHQPFETYPVLIRDAVRKAGGTAQVAGGVPAMCDGVTQGEAGMELSLFSRDTIAMATGVAMSHNVFDAAVYLGVCDKIVPGLVIGAQAFGHIPAVFLPAGPMTSGLANDEKAHIRQKFAAGEIGREELLKAEMAAYHGPGTCTFYGTANSNQMLMEVHGPAYARVVSVRQSGHRYARCPHPVPRPKDATLSLTALGDELYPCLRICIRRERRLLTPLSALWLQAAPPIC